MDEPTSDAAARRAEQVLRSVRSGVRQRTAELAAVPGGEGVRHKLVDLRTREFLREPVPFSHRPGLGGLIVLARKAFFKLFLKWWSRPVLEQQTAFNQATTLLLQDLVTSAERQEHQLRDVAARLEALEHRLDELERQARNR